MLDVYLAILANKLGFDHVRKYIVHNLWGFESRANKYTAPVIEIDPDEIKYTSSFPFALEGEDAIVGEGRGNWYLARDPYEDSCIYRSLHMRYNQGIDWFKTPRIQHMEQRIESGSTSWDNIQDYIRSIEELKENIEENGYLPQKDLPENKKSVVKKQYNGYKFSDEIRVAISKNNQVIKLPHRSHRTALSKILGIDKIPVIVQIAHVNSTKDINPICEYNPHK